MVDEENIGKKSQEDPGAARFGNFINYYSFNPPENRLKFLPESLISLLAVETNSASPVSILDVGCNAGVSPCKKHQSY